jgi:hypothetical protein
MEDVITLPSGEPLSAEAASRISAAAESRLILVAGMNGSGKTTLLASVYERFQKGAFGGFQFAGSKTLIGFEKRCFLSRMESGRNEPDTLRTEFSDSPDFLHLRLANAPGKPHAVRDMLFTDLSGEAFRHARDSADDCRKMTTLKQADHILLLIDGRKVSDPALRSVATDDATLLLRRSIECEMLGKRSLVDVVLTKLDKIRASTDPEAAIRFWKRHKELIRHKYADRIGRIRFFETAARPDVTSSLELAHGLAEPLSSWVIDSLQHESVGTYELAPAPSNREFDRFALRFGSRLKATDAL